MTLGDIVRQHRKNLGISMYDFAEKCGLSKGYISMIENNVNPINGKPITPSLSTIGQIADGMGMSLIALLELMYDSHHSQKPQNKNDDILPEEFNEFSRFIGKLGYYITLDDMQYYMVKDKKRVAISVDELKMLVRNSESVVKSLLESLMNKDT